LLVTSVADAIRSRDPSSDPDPELNDVERQGKVIFIRACATCHGSPLHPGMSMPDATIVGGPVQCF